MRQDIIELYDAYTHEHLDRRVFMDRLAEVAGGTAADDARLTIEEVTFPGASGDMQGYLARPAAALVPLPGIVVIHENRGLNPHIQMWLDVRRWRALWSWRPTFSHRRAARLTTPTRRAR